MSHLSVIALLEDTAKSLGDNIRFGYGRRSDFNLIPNKRNPYIWALPLTATPVFAVNNTHNYMKTWNVIMIFLDFDRSDSDEKEYKLILDRMDLLVDKFINRLNDWSLKPSDTVGEITLRNFNQQPFFKSDADIFTGWIVSFQLVTPDDFIYCTPDNIELYAGNS